MANALPGTPSCARDLGLGFLAGALAVAVFHQGMVWVLSQVGLIQSQVYAMRGVPPFGVPTMLNQMFWGGLWGLLFAALADRLPRGPRLLLGVAFGVLGPVLVSWFVVAPLKGIPIAAGWVPQRMVAGILLNGCWGIGLALLYAALRRWAAGPRQAQAV
jgi:MFS family permease